MKLTVFLHHILPESVFLSFRRWHHVLRLPSFHEEESETVARLVLPNFVAIDVGANIGTFTRVLAERANTVYAIEPIPDTFRTLALARKLYRWNNVHLINAAVSNHNGTVHMEVPRWSDGRLNPYESHIVNDVGSHTVKAITIDGLNLERVDFIKIDVEGHECEVLEGARTTLLRFHPVLLIEVASPNTKPLLTSLGYRVSAEFPSNVLFAAQ